MLQAALQPPLTSGIDVRVPPNMKDALKPMLIFLCVGLLISLALSVWSYDNEKRRHAVQFWTGGLGVIGVMAIGCAVILLIYGARVFEDVARTVQNDAAAVEASVEKMSDKVKGGVNVLGGLMSKT